MLEQRWVVVRYGLTALLLAAPALAETAGRGALTLGVSVSAPWWAFNARPVESELAFEADQSRTVGPGWVAARIRARASNDGSRGLRVFDAGTGLELGWRGEGWKPTEAVTLTLRPWDTLRLRPSFDVLNAWGRAFAPTAFAPSAVVGYDRGPALGLLALMVRSHPTITGVGAELEPVLLVGAGLRLGAPWTLEVRGQVLDRGLVPSARSMGLDRRVTAGGVSGRLSWSLGGGVEEFPLLSGGSDDPERVERVHRPEHYDPGWAAIVRLEAGVASESLLDGTSAWTMTDFTTGSLDLQGRVRRGPVRLFARGRLAPPRFLVFDLPGLPAFFATPDAESVEVSLSAGADYRFEGARTTVGVLAGLLRPAAFFGAGASSSPGSGGSAVRALQVGGLNAFSFLPPGELPSPEGAFLALVRVDPSESVSALLEVAVTVTSIFPFEGAARQWHASPSGLASLQYRF